jgi:hypothetical protein
VPSAEIEEMLMFLKALSQVGTADAEFAGVAVLINEAGWRFNRRTKNEAPSEPDSDGVLRFGMGAHRDGGIRA